MGCVGTIVEFNPLHAGHLEHLRESKAISQKEKLIVVMSGDFVQRGEPALCDKWLRTRMALLAGVDIVIEIPVPFVVMGADYFARAGVGLLAASGVVDVLSFGSECGDISALQAAGRVLADEPADYKHVLREELDSGVSFAAARGAALCAVLGDVPDGLLTAPNNGLAMEYCKALRLLGDPMEVFTTFRKSGGASATKIRKNFPATEGMPAYAAEMLKNVRKTTLDDFSEIFRFLLYSREFRLGEGLENRFRNLCGEYVKISEIVAAVKTKRYTHTRLQRAVLQMLLGITAADVDLQYIRVLGFRRESADLLGAMAKKASLPVITYGAVMDEIMSGAYGTAAARMLEMDLRAGDIYRCASRSAGGYRAERAVPIVKV